VVKMKRRICEISGCRKTGTVKLRNNHWICEDCAKKLREYRRAGKKVKGFYKEIPLGYWGDFKVFTDVLVKL